MYNTVKISIIQHIMQNEVILVYNIIICIVKHGMYSVYIPKNISIFTRYTSMYAVNATIKILQILTKVVILTGF